MQLLHNAVAETERKTSFHVPPIKNFEEGKFPSVCFPDTPSGKNRKIILKESRKVGKLLLSAINEFYISSDRSSRRAKILNFHCFGAF